VRKQTVTCDLCGMPRSSSLPIIGFGVFDPALCRFMPELDLCVKCYDKIKDGRVKVDS